MFVTSDRVLVIKTTHHLIEIEIQPHGTEIYPIFHSSQCHFLLPTDPLIFRSANSLIAVLKSDFKILNINYVNHQ
jgi:hypothetical protein